MDLLSYLIIGIGIGLSAWVVITQKPWWKLSPKEKKEKLPLVIVGALLLVLGIVVFMVVN